MEGNLEGLAKWNAKWSVGHETYEIDAEETIADLIYLQMENVATDNTKASCTLIAEAKKMNLKNFSSCILRRYYLSTI